MTLTRRLCVMLATTFLLTPPAASADLSIFPTISPLTPAMRTSGFYIGARQGIGTTDKTKFSTNGGRTSFTTDYDVALRNSGMLGYNFGPVAGIFSPRLEIEAGYMNQSVNKHSVSARGVTLTPGSKDSFGDLKSLSALTSGYLDLNLDKLSGAPAGSWMARLKPFVGGGVGVSQVTARRQGVSSTGVVMDDSDTRMSWHASAGLGYQMSDTTVAEVGFRHLRTEGLTLTARDGTRSKNDLVNNLVTLGIRKSF